VVRGDGAVVTSKAGAEEAAVLEIEFRDGKLVVGGRTGRRPKGDGESGQGSLF
jgi:exodeoxyribonuclease VII large subunit